MVILQARRTVSRQYQCQFMVRFAAHILRRAEANADCHSRTFAGYQKTTFNRRDDLWVCDNIIHVIADFDNFIIYLYGNSASGCIREIGNVGNYKIYERKVISYPINYLR